MNSVPRLSSLFLCLLLLLIFGARGQSPACAQNLDFVVIQPGQPGSAAEARPVMAALAAYLQERLGMAMEGRYFNELEPALDYLRNSPPSWGIVALGVYVGEAAVVPMVPIAASLPGGFDSDRWRLVAGPEGPEDWTALTGTVTGTMLFTGGAAACLVFGSSAEELPFSLEGTFEPLRHLRAVVRGAEPAMILDRVQYEAAAALPAAAQIRVLHDSGDLPTSPVVWFGQENEAMHALTGALTAMSGDPAASSLLQHLQTAGFGPVHPDLHRLRMTSDEHCPQ